MRGKIEQAKRSKSRKTISLKIGDRWYSTKNFALENAVGSLIEFQAESSEWPEGSGNFMWWANEAFVVEHAAPEVHPDPRASLQRGQHDDGQQTIPARISKPDAIAYLPMTSNVVAHAITAGAITEPSQIRAWAQSAFDAARTVVEGTQPDDFSDNIPF